MAGTEIVNPDLFKPDPRVLSWLGAAVIPKLESAKDMFVPRERFVVEFKSYKDHFKEVKQASIS